MRGLQKRNNFIINTVKLVESFEIQNIIRLFRFFWSFGALMSFFEYSKFSGYDRCSCDNDNDKLTGQRGTPGDRDQVAGKLV